MCGIAGCVVAPGRRPDRSALERMARALEPRGPDDEGIELWENVGLVNRRLAIVDTTDAGHQPISDPGGRWTISFNGEVYNHLELRRALGAGPWRGHSDSETLVGALARWGDSALARCNGPMGLAALDRDGRRLVLARDRFQKKPLYFARDSGTVWFASEVRALLAAGLPARCDRAALAHTTVHGWLNGPLTPLDGVERIAGGTLREIDIDSLVHEDRTWFDPTDQLDPELAEQLARMPREDLTRAFDRALRDSVERRLMSDAPVGTMLSGGLDSSLVTALARAAGADVTAFTASVPTQPRVDETRHARRASEALGVPLEAVTIEPDDWPGYLVRAVWLHEYPLLSPAIALIEPIEALARERGVKVLLTGEAADELLAGYDHLHPREIAGFLRPPAAAIRAVGAIRRSRGLLPGVIRRRGLRYSGPGPFPREPTAERRRRELVARAEAASGHRDRRHRRLEAQLLADLYHSHFGHLLNRMDKNAMGASVETRIPFLDPELTRLILNLPLERRVGRHPKPIVREVAAGHLPAAIARRPKQISMHYNVARVFRRSADPTALSDGALRDALELTAPEWAQITAASSGVPVIWLWSAEIWARLFLEGSSVEQVERELFGARA